MPLFEINKRKRKAKEFKSTVAKGKKDYKNQKSSATAVSGTMEGKQVNTTKSMFTEYDVGKPRTLKGSPHPPYNKDMSNRITVKDETPAPSYMKATKTYDAETMKTSVYDGGWDPKKAEEESQKNKNNSGGFFSKMFKGSGDKTNADNAIKSAQSLLDRSLRKKK